MHEFDVAVALIGDDGDGRDRSASACSSGRSRHEMLDEDLRAVGLEPETTTYAADVPNYVVTARRPR